MKKKTLFCATLLIIIGVACGVKASLFNMNSSTRELFDANVDALTSGESGYRCTGPKTENLAGHIFCHCENTNPCSDTYGC